MLCTGDCKHNFGVRQLARLDWILCEVYSKSVASYDDAQLPTSLRNSAQPGKQMGIPARTETASRGAQTDGARDMTPCLSKLDTHPQLGSKKNLHSQRQHEESSTFVRLVNKLKGKAKMLSS